MAWIASSLGLHRLLTFYGDRPGARAAAHNKFIASRAAELCLVAALALGAAVAVVINPTRMTMIPGARGHAVRR